jgi:SAM-dependent methyltransferase
MAGVEERHWWYRGLRDVLLDSVRNQGAQLPEHPRVLDAGCGTGENLKALSTALQPSYLGGFDASEDALSFARQKCPSADLFISDICNPNLREKDLDLIISTDVIYIPGAKVVLPGLQQLVSALRPGGLFVVNVPAYQWLFSDHDIAVHTSERFTTTSLRALLLEAGLRIDILTYRICLLFPLVVAGRLPSLLRGPRTGSDTKSDLYSVPGKGVSRILYSTVLAENALIARKVSLPFGSSVFAVARKPAA